MVFQVMREVVLLIYLFRSGVVLLQVISGVLELGAGWYSAMAQGQAMSLLVRAAHHSGDPRYLRAAARATSLFTINATQGEHWPGYNFIKHVDSKCI